MATFQVAQGARFAPHKSLQVAFVNNTEPEDNTSYVWTGDRAVLNTVTWFSMTDEDSPVSGWVALFEDGSTPFAETLDEAFVLTEAYEQR